MIDQCKHCVYIGDLKQCKETDCSIHESWYAKTLSLEIAHIQYDLETERLRLAACGVAALGYFDVCKQEYRSASLDDVLRLYNKNLALQAKIDALMLEYCPDEMTKEQIDNFEKHQERFDE